MHLSSNQNALVAGLALTCSRSTGLREERTRARRGLAERRNRFVAELSDAVLIGYATPGGARDLLAPGRTVYVIDDPANAPLMELGARLASAERLMRDLVTAGVRAAKP